MQNLTVLEERGGGRERGRGVEGVFTNPFLLFLALQAFHQQCYCCASCEKNLMPGEEVGMNNNKFLCKSDLDLIQNDQMDSPTGKPLPPPISPSPSLFSTNSVAYVPSVGGEGPSCPVLYVEQSTVIVAGL